MIDDYMELTPEQAELVKSAGPDERCLFYGGELVKVPAERMAALMAHAFRSGIEVAAGELAAELECLLDEELGRGPGEQPEERRLRAGRDLREPLPVQRHFLVAAGLLERGEVDERDGALDGAAAGPDEVLVVDRRVAEVDLRLEGGLLHRLREPQRSKLSGPVRPV